MNYILNFKTDLIAVPKSLECIIPARVVSVITITYKVDKSKETNNQNINQIKKLKKNQKS